MSPLPKNFHLFHYNVNTQKIVSDFPKKATHIKFTYKGLNNFIVIGFWSHYIRGMFPFEISFLDQGLINKFFIHFELQLQ